ncbi:MAG: DinB family protein [Candidatus Heimdallarchaeota archaeon]|nr:DinB family protein [Candidatus Heimdallarchaeota archaeon]
MSHAEEFKKASLSQLLATLAMARDIIEKCTDELWIMKISDHKLAQLMYHALFYTDFYLNDLNEEMEQPSENYVLPEFFEKDKPQSDLSVEVEEVLPRSRLLDFVDYIEKRAIHLVSNVKDKTLLEKSGFHWLPMSKMEVVIYLSRHLMEHTGQIYGFIRDKQSISIPWVARIDK